MDPATISALLSGGPSILGGLNSLFGDDGSDALDRALDQAREQFQQGSQAQETAARRELALYDPFYQSGLRAYNNYLRELGQDYITDDPVLASMRHNADNYIAVGPDGRSYVVDTIPGYTGGNTPRPLGSTPQQSSNGGGSLRDLLLGNSGGNGNNSGAPADPNGLKFDASKGTPIGTIGGVTYYRRDEDSLMPYTWAKGTGERGGPDLSLSAYEKSPGYDFQFGQGVQALDRSAAANGRLDSGRQAKALTEFGQGLAKTDYYGWADREQQRYDNWVSRLAQLAGQAPVAAGQVGGVYGNMGQGGANSANSLANLALTRGSTEADLTARSQSSFNNGISGILGGAGRISTLWG